MGQQGVRGLLLIWSKRTVERHVDWFAQTAFVANGEVNLQLREQFAQIVQTTSRQADVSRVVLGARHDARLAVRGQSHRLGLVELRILKRRQPNDWFRSHGLSPSFGM